MAEGLFVRLEAAADLAESAGHKMKFTVITGIKIVYGPAQRTNTCQRQQGKVNFFAMPFLDK